MKRIFILLINAIILLSCFETVFSSDKDGLMGDDGNNSIFYFSLFPGRIHSDDDKTAMIQISSPKNSPVEITKKDISLKDNLFVNQNDFIEFLLAAKDIQPTTKFKYNLPADIPIEMVFKNSAVKMIVKGSTDATAVLKTLYFERSDAITLMNTSQLGSHYQISNPSKTRHTDTIPSNYIVIVSPYENTSIDFIMGGITGSFVNLENGNILKPTEKTHRTMHEGDVWLIPLGSSKGNLAGSLVTANKPVAVFSGANTAFISGSNSMNYSFNQELPQEFWGNHYLIPTLPGRTLYPIINIFSSQSETTINSDGVPTWTIDQPGGTLNLGYIEVVAGQKKQGETVPHPVVISSEVPINVALINPQSGEYVTSSIPFQMQIIPTSQFTNNAIFKIDNVNEDIINIIYLAPKNGKIPDGVMFTKITGGKYEWKKLNTISSENGQQYAGYLPDSSHFRSLTMKLPETGVYAIKSDVPLQVYQFGTGISVYGYPISGHVNEFDKPDTLAPNVEFTLDERCGATGTVTDEPKDEPSARSNLGILSMLAEDSYNFIFDYDEFEPGVTPSTNWRAKVRNPLVNARAHLFFTDRLGNRKDTIIECESIFPEIKPYKMDFGKVRVNQTPTEIIKSFEISKYSENDYTGKFKMFIILDSDSTENKSGDINSYQNFDILSVKGTDIYPQIHNKTLNFEIKFTANSKGIFKDSVGILLLKKNNTNSKYEFYDMFFMTELSAVAGESKIHADDNDFGPVNVDKASTTEFLVKNPSDDIAELSMPLNITGYQFTGNDIGLNGSGKAFEVSGLDNVSMQNPLVIEPDNQKSLFIKFEAKEIKDYSAEIIFEADADKPDNKIILSGKGIPATSVEENRICNQIEILNMNGYLKFISKENYLLYNIEIYDLSGKTVLNEKVAEELNTYTINTSNYKKGVYFIKLFINGCRINKKIII